MDLGRVLGARLNADKVHVIHRQLARNFFAILTMFFVGFVAPSAHSANGSNCPGTFSALAKRLGLKFFASDEAMQGVLVEAWAGKIHPRVREWLNFNSLQMSSLHLPYKPGDRINLLGEKLRVVSVLGKGVEAPQGVYLVETRTGLKVVKIFRNDWALKLNLKSIDALKAVKESTSPSIGIPTIVKIDVNKSMVLMDYAEGIDVDTIRLLHGQFGVGKPQADAIYQRWIEVKTAIEANGFRSPAAFNFVYSFKTDSFTIIDPH